MKIKTWLFVSYLIVMILPLLAAYYLLVWINEFNKDLEVKDYFEKWTELQSIIPLLKQQEFYQLGEEYPELDNVTSDKTEISLYLKEGLLLYTSNPISIETTRFINQEELYKNLYQFNSSFNAYTYKEPVFNGNELIGFFEVRLVRSEWIMGVSNMTRFVIAGFIVIFMMIFGAVVYFVNRKLNRPLKQLISQMQTFARNEEVKPIRITNDEIGELAKSFEEMKSQIILTQIKLDQEQKEKEYMIASVSHDLKTPLTSIRAYAEGLKNKENIEEYSSIIIDKSNYMKQMLDDLLMYTLLQSPSYHISTVEVDGNEFFEMLVSDYDVLCQNHGITLKTICYIHGMFEVDPTQLLRVTDNLMSNAIKHTEINGEIVIAAIDHDSEVEGLYTFSKDRLVKDDGMYLVVQNSGKGINERDIENVLKPLYQVDEARTKNGKAGTGLGLSIAKLIIEKHGGSIEVVSKLDIGTSVIVWLPSKKGDNKNENK
nr:HAMP domain-containing sensor histidine kinase [Lysinibacillus timonensis]